MYVEFGDKMADADKERQILPAGRVNPVYGSVDDGPDNPENDSDNDDIKCVACSDSHAIKIQDAKPGDHIQFKSTPSWYKIVYDHHAIVEKIDSENNKAYLIHYWNNGSACCKPKLLREPLPFSKIGKVKKIVYKNSNDETKRLEIAREACETSNDKYHLFFNNCEHFCHYVCVDRKASKQVSNCFRRFGDCLLGFILSVPKLIWYFLGTLVLTVDDIVTVIDSCCEAAILFPLLFFYLVYVFVRNCSSCNSQCCNLHKLCGIGNICPDCQKRDKCLRWIRFAIVLFFQLLEFALSVYFNQTGKPVVYHVFVGVGCGIVTMIFILLLKLYDYCRKRIKNTLHAG